MPKKIFVTGAAGYLGSTLVRKLYKQKHKITIFDIKDASHPFLRGLKIKKIKGDIRDYPTLLKAMKGCDYVYNLSACILNTPKAKNTLFSVNIRGSENVMNACLKLGIKKVVHVSSSSIFGFSKNGRIKLNENDVLDFKDNIYGQSKKLGDDKVQEYIAKGLNVTIVCPGSVFGAGEIEPLELIRNIKRGRIKFTFPGGTSVIAIDDIVNGMISAMEKGRKGQKYILSNQYMRFKEMYNKIANVLKAPKIKYELPRITYYPMYLLAATIQTVFKNPPLTTEMVRWSYHYRNLDISKARRELGWKPVIPFEEAVKQALKHYKKFNMLN